MQAITPTSNSHSILNMSHGKSRKSTFSTPTTENHKWFKVVSDRNQDQVSVSVSGPELFLPKPKFSPILKIYLKIISVMN